MRSAPSLCSSFPLRPLCLLLGSWLAASALHAEEAALGTQTVSSSRMAASRSELAATVQIIDGETLRTQLQAGLNLKEALGHLVPGIDLGNQGRSAYGQNLRGRPMLVMIDGVSLNSARGTARQLDAIDAFHIERIEVLSGASALYGGGATGGIVNIITKKAADAPTRYSSELGLTSGFAGGRDLQWRMAQSIAGGNDVVQGRLGLAVQDYGDFYDAQGRKVRTDITQTDMQNTRSLDLLGNLQFELGGGQSLNLTGQYYRNKFDGGSYLYAGPNMAGIFGRPELLEQRSGFYSDVMPMTERQMFNADYHARNVLGGHDLYLQGFYRQEKLDFAPYPGAYVSASHQNTDAWGLKAALSKDLGPVTLRYGLDWDRESFDGSQTVFDRNLALASGGMNNVAVATTGRYPGYRINSTAVFGQLEWKLGPRTSVQAGWRHQRQNLAVDDFVAATQQVLPLYGQGRTADAIPGGRNSYSVNLFNAGVHFKPSARQSTWLSYAEGFELPDPGKYYGNGQYVLNGNHWQLVRGVSPDSSPLQGIKTRQVEWGGKGKWGALSAQTAVFYAWSDHSLAITPGTMTIDVLDDKRRNYGWEGALDYQIGSAWTVGGSWLWIRSENKTATGWQRQSIMTASPSKLTAHATWRHGLWNTRLQATHLRTLRDAAGQRIQGYTTWDAMASVKLPVGQLQFGVQNLLNKSYLSTWSQRAMALYAVPPVSAQTFAFYGQGRTFSVNYRVDY
jgi:iron complex outermembrane receptor protein